MSRLLSGVRSSCDMFARNSDLYFEVSASCSAFSSTDARASSISRFFFSTSRFCSASSSAFSSSSSLVCCSSSCCCLRRSSDACSVRACCSSRVLVSRQLLLPGLQLRRQRLRLLQQLLGAHRRDDRVEHDADALGELIEEREVDLAEPLERRELDDGLDLALEQDRQHDDVHRRRLAEARGDLDVIGRHVREQDALLLERRLADQALARLEPVREVLALR